ncbi:MAG: zinc-binding alcohol dehydrogenase family protein [Treponemataceae bacterium]
MKAIIVPKPFEILIEEVPTPTIRNDDDVLIKVVGAGICGSDIHIFTGTNTLATYPRLIGHEYGGVVAEIGKGVKGLKAGDVVAVDPVRSCGVCYPCSIGRHNVCEKLEVTGVHRDGGFAEYVLAPAANVYKLDSSIVPKEFACMAEPFSIGAQVNARARTGEGDLMLVMGSGPIGLCIMQVAKSRGAKVIMTDILDARLKRASAMGADRTVNVKNENLEQAVKEFTKGLGATIVADSVCSVESFPLALQLACAAGRVISLGLDNKPTPIAQVNITKKELDVMGSRLSNYRFPEVVKGFENGSLTPKAIVTHQFPFAKVKDAIELVRTKPEEVCKVLVRFDQN